MTGKLTKMLAVVGLSAAFAAPAFAADGQVLYETKGCAACHGADGNTPTAPIYPKLVGQPVQYLVTQMTDIKSGARNNGMTAVMKPIMANVSEAEIAVLAQWLSEKGE
ncbi:c-type cytochrome [Thiohalomonas denitrificans]|uniref:Cytochrome c n=1 Tax=Thiohalomonas denitrificans TaxID=415747 RepID=A0A1G5QS86_9GAMM|nr:cytochrome c [Thiohalomonas denitrificans]SCZ64438.1 cytochrome c [Thiohalomonas denitrificans]